MLMGSSVFVTKQFLSKIKVSYDNTNFHNEEPEACAGRGKRLTSSRRDSDRLRGPPTSYSL